jgi:phage repressor protein C with HTH and peptisase S24 domain
MDYECERFVVPIFRGAEFLIRVQGDSMMPRYMPGDIVACKRVPLDKLWFQWGKTYIVDTRQGALIKRLEPSSADGCVSIHSENEAYKPFDLPTDEINGVALVVGLIRVE